ncbi:MAG: CDP-alcohol phosphatidyltransferase family protein [Actinomycetota bacterium]|nr:CDP-alcohol phosphatidyltransferase family protein [Actinomycetota bacterium]
MTAGAAGGDRGRILTIPNALSALRIALIPLFVMLLLGEDTRLVGLLLVGLVASTDWVDGYVARRTGAVTRLGELLDPVADRLAIAAALIALIAIGAFPVWAALVVLVRDAVVLVAGTVLTLVRDVRIPVRPMGKYATFTIWWGLGMVAWGNLGFALADAAAVLGWTWFAVGVVEYYAATVAYAGDVRRALAAAGA